MDFIKRLLEFLFGKKKEQKALSFDEAMGIIDSELAGLEKELLDYAPKKFAEIKYLVSSLAKSASALEGQQINLDEGNKRFRQIVATSQKNLARQLRGLSQKISPPARIDIDSVRAYSNAALRAVSTDLLPYWKNVALTKTLLKDEIRSVGDNLKELSAALDELNSKANSKELSGLYEMKRLIASAAEHDLKVSGLSAAQDATKKEIASARTELALLEKSLEEKLNSREAIELGRIELEKKGLEERKSALVSSFNSQIAPLEKVLKRLHALSQSSGLLAAKEKEILPMLLSSPYSALIADPNGTVAKSLLSKAEKLIHDGSIQLKDDEKEKRLAAISGFLSKDIFTEYFWQMNKIQVDSVNIEKKLSTLAVAGQVKSLKDAIDSASKSVEEEKRELENIQRHSALMATAQHRQKLTELFNRHFSGKCVLGDSK